MPITTVVLENLPQFYDNFLKQRKTIFLDPFYAILCVQKFGITFFGKRPKSTFFNSLFLSLSLSQFVGTSGDTKIEFLALTRQIIYHLLENNL